MRDGPPLSRRVVGSSGAVCMKRSSDLGDPVTVVAVVNLAAGSAGCRKEGSPYRRDGSIRQCAVLPPLCNARFQLMAA